MRKSLIFLCILTVAFIAFFDAKDRIEELDEVAANTPSQVEMKQMMNKPREQIKNHIPDVKPTEAQNNQNNNIQNKGNTDIQNQFNKIDERRNTIPQQTN